MELDVFPPVAEQLRQALQDALEETMSNSLYDAAWRRASLAEGIDLDDDTDYAPSPRSTRGATRA